jgi:type I restriction enzyme R subunit
MQLDAVTILVTVVLSSGLTFLLVKLFFSEVIKASVSEAIKHPFELQKQEHQHKLDLQKQELQKAHRKVYHKELADIISMVKHAAKEEEAVLTAEERVEKAMQRFMRGKAFNEQQLKWLGYIKGHLVENLTIGVDDFNLLPIFEQRGGLKAAQKAFDQKVESIVAEINLSIAA